MVDMAVEDMGSGVVMEVTIDRTMEVVEVIMEEDITDIEDHIMEVGAIMEVVDMVVDTVVVMVAALEVDITMAGEDKMCATKYVLL